jgi:putative ABC transport system ATP-binding protein
MLRLESICKSYTDGDETISILEQVSLTVETGEKIAIIGPSGSGKSTLLSIMSLLDSPTSGKVYIDGVDTSTLNERELARMRNTKLGIIFQSFELVQFFTAYENIMLPLAIRSVEYKEKVDAVCEEVGLSHRKHNLPSARSGGEQQRVAIARVLVADSDIIFADEPTGNLDALHGKKILDLLLYAVNQKKKTCILITHDMNIAKQMDKIYEIKDKQLILRTL